MQPIKKIKYVCPVCENEFESKSDTITCIKAHQADCPHCFEYDISELDMRNKKFRMKPGAKSYLKLKKRCRACGLVKTKNMFDIDILTNIDILRKLF